MANTNTASKVNTQASKMSTREAIASAIATVVSNFRDKIETVSDGVWKFAAIDTGDGPKDYVVKCYDKQGKSGKMFKQRELYRVVDGAETKVELGEYKKAYLYKIIKSLTTPKVERTKRIAMVSTDVIALRDAIKKNKTAFSINDKGSLVGKLDAYGDIEIVNGAIKPMKNGHKRNFGRKLYINGQLVHEGSLLNCCFNTFNAKGRTKKAPAAKVEA